MIGYSEMPNDSKKLVFEESRKHKVPKHWGHEKIEMSFSDNRTVEMSNPETGIPAKHQPHGNY